MRGSHLVWAMVLVFCLSSFSTAYDDGKWWPQFRGPNASGIAEHGHYPIEFGPDTNLLWKTALPEGHSSPCIWKDYIFLTGFDKQKKKLETICLNRTNGTVLWRRVAPTQAIEQVSPVNSPASPTPATDGKHVYVYFGSFGLLCYDFDGTEIWKLSLPIPKTKHGSSTSPIVAAGLVILNLDQEGRWFQDEEEKWQQDSRSYIMAVDGTTGKVVWKTKRPLMKATYSIPLIWQADKHHEVVVQGRNQLVAYNLLDGTRTWWCNGIPPTASSTPVIGDGHLFLAAQDNLGEPDNIATLPEFDSFLESYDENNDGKISKDEVPTEFSVIGRDREDGAGSLNLLQWFPDKDDDGAINRLEWSQLSNQLQEMKPKMRQGVVSVRLGGTGNVTKTHVAWRDTRGVPEVPSPLFYENRIYYIKNGGIVYCRSALDGSVLYKGRLGPSSNYYASPVVGDGRIYSAAENGIVVVFDAENSDSCKVLSRNDLGERIMATPALADGKIYVRTANHLWAFGV